MKTQKQTTKINHCLKQMKEESKDSHSSAYPKEMEGGKK